jgi:hypothetical protein
MQLHEIELDSSASLENANISRRDERHRATDKIIILFYLTSNIASNS